MRSRIAILLMLVFGFALSGAGAGLAVSGVVGDSETATVAQYGETPPTGPTPQLVPPAPAQGVAGEQNTGKPAPRSEAPDRVAGGNVVEPTQVTRQLSADTTDELPFTGFAAIPILLIGVFLLVSGFVLRRGNRSGSEA